MLSHYSRPVAFILTAFFVLASAATLTVMAQDTDRYPGYSGATTELQKQTFPAVMYSTKIKLKDRIGCNYGDVMNTEVVQTDSDDAPTENGLVSTAWQEEWTVDYCGQEMIVPVNFSPDGLGGTTYSIEPATIRPVDAPQSDTTTP